MGAKRSAMATKVVLALADMAPATDERAPGLMVPTEWFRWLPLAAVRLLIPSQLPGQSAMERLALAAGQSRSVPLDRKFASALAAVDRIRPAQRSLRAGWLFVAGRFVAPDGQSRRVLHPLVSVPVRVERAGGSILVPAGDVEVSARIGDGAALEELESSVELGGGAFDGLTDVVAAPTLIAKLPRLKHFARSAAAAAELAATELVGATGGPRRPRPPRWPGHRRGSGRVRRPRDGRHQPGQHAPLVGRPPLGARVGVPLALPRIRGR